MDDTEIWSCPICWNAEASPHLLVPCGHSVCETCTPKVTSCPECRTKIERSVVNYSLKRATSKGNALPAAISVPPAGSNSEKKLNVPVKLLVISQDSMDGLSESKKSQCVDALQKYRFCHLCAGEIDNGEESKCNCQCTTAVKISLGMFSSWNAVVRLRFCSKCVIVHTKDRYDKTFAARKTQCANCKASMFKSLVECADCQFFYCANCSPAHTAAEESAKREAARKQRELHERREREMREQRRLEQEKTKTQQELAAARAQKLVAEQELQFVKDQVAAHRRNFDGYLTNLILLFHRVVGLYNRFAPLSALLLAIVLEQIIFPDASTTVMPPFGQSWLSRACIVAASFHDDRQRSHWLMIGLLGRFNQLRLYPWVPLAWLLSPQLAASILLVTASRSVLSVLLVVASTALLVPKLGALPLDGFVRTAITRACVLTVTIGVVWLVNLPL